MATERQRKLAKAIVENAVAKKPKNKKELLVSSGYSVISAEASPGVIIEQKGVQEELRILGFDSESAKKVVSEILNGDKIAPKDRLRAADMVFKVDGTYAPEKTDLTTKGEPLMNSDVAQILEEVVERLKESKT